MNILSKSVKSLNFSDVVSFCEEGVPEGIQIDYKKEFPQKGFAKHFASFSNTRGGVIIIGVEEDRKSGSPSVWEGVNRDAKQIEKIHQEAGNVEPIPSYEVHVTDEVEGKCFVLIRIYEGDKTPYRPQNDSNVWVRTGNVSNPIDIASPDGLELLFGKKEKAEKARELYLERAEEVFTAGLERERKKEGREEVGSNAIVCRIAIQPYFPQKALGNPQEIKAALDGMRFRTRYVSFPNLNMEAIPEGLFSFVSGGGGYFQSEQIYSQGLIFEHFDALSVQSDGRRVVPLWRVIGQFLAITQFAKAFYVKFGYQGNLEGFISLEGMEDVFVAKLKPSNRMFFDDDNKSFIKDYRWKIDMDTDTLQSPERLKAYIFGLIREIYWHFGYEEITDPVMEDYLKEAGLSL
ncbi:MAG: hypothetical protein A2808_03850 [Candidatus Moranbacteria bacterium RIFCSPHIGHO2_01_FULL_55_24]|nr:MAG: hypothetical protein A2808_03850 [Candidatus Moranbacteria bacterium RIFCSPHIGHO2_01_FULL_55_24]